MEENLSKLSSSSVEWEEKAKEAINFPPFTGGEVRWQEKLHEHVISLLDSTRDCFHYAQQIYFSLSCGKQRRARFMFGRTHTGRQRGGGGGGGNGTSWLNSGDMNRARENLQVGHLRRLCQSYLTDFEQFSQSKVKLPPSLRLSFPFYFFFGSLLLARSLPSHLSTQIKHNLWSYRVWFTMSTF